MADVKINLDISARGDAAQKLQGTAEAAQKASAQYQALAASAGRAADSQSRLSSGGVSGPSGGGAGGGAAEQALTGAARQMSAATTQLAQSQRQSAAETRTAMQTQATRAAEAGQARAAGQGAEGGGPLSGVLGKLLGGFVGLQGAQKLLGGVGTSLAASQDQTLDPALRARKVGESLPFVGGLVKSFQELSDAVDGTTARLALLKQEYTRESETLKALGERRAGEATAEAQARETAARAGAFGQQRFFGMPGALRAPAPQIREGIDRTTVQGEREYQEAVRRLPAEGAARGARLGEQAAQKVFEGSEEDIRVRQERFDKAKRLADETAREAERVRNAPLPGAGAGGLGSVIKAGLGGGLEGAIKEVGRGGERSAGLADRVAAYQKAKLAVEELQQRQEQLAQAEQRHAANAVALENAKSAARKANIGLMKEQLAVVNDEVQRISSASQAWAGLSAAEKMATENALERAKTQGLAALSGEERGLLGRAAPQFIAKEQEKAAQADPAFKRFQEAQGEKADLAGARKQQVQLQNKIEVEMAVDEGKLADALNDRMVKALERVIDALAAKMDARLRDFEAGLRIKQAGG